MSLIVSYAPIGFDILGLCCIGIPSLSAPLVIIVLRPEEHRRVGYWILLVGSLVPLSLGFLFETGTVPWRQQDTFVIVGGVFWILGWLAWFFFPPRR